MGQQYFTTYMYGGNAKCIETWDPQNIKHMDTSADGSDVQTFVMDKEG